MTKINNNCYKHSDNTIQYQNIDKTSPIDNPN